MTFLLSLYSALYFIRDRAHVKVNQLLRLKRGTLFLLDNSLIKEFHCAVKLPFLFLELDHYLFSQQGRQWKHSFSEYFPSKRSSSSVWTSDPFILLLWWWSASHKIGFRFQKSISFFFFFFIIFLWYFPWNCSSPYWLKFYSIKGFQLTFCR